MISRSLFADEELYSRRVLKSFVNSTTFANLNVGFAFDEAGVSSTDEILVVYAENSVWRKLTKISELDSSLRISRIVYFYTNASTLEFNYTVSAHGSTMPAMTAGQKLKVVINRVMEYKASQAERLNDPE